MNNLDNQTLTKKERRLLRKQEKKDERLHLIKKRQLTKTLSIGVIVILVFGGIILGMVINSQKNETNNSQTDGGRPQIEITKPEFDAGTVSMASGLINHSYEIKNIGNGDLVIDEIWTSCHCTTAVLKVAGRESPRFGMEKSFVFWSQKISPNEGGQLEVTFDPAYHGPQGLGSTVRAIYLTTNDPDNKKVEVRLLADVIH